MLPHPSLGEARRAASQRIELPYWKTAPHIVADVISLGQYRWDPVPHADEPLTWMTGMRTDDHGGRRQHPGRAWRAHIYLVTRSMEDEYFYSADGELLVVPQEGRLRFCTELGVIDLEPKEIAILPRGLVYRVEVLEGPARGFVCENYGQKFDAARPRARSARTAWPTRATSRRPVAAFEDREVPSTRDASSGAASSTRPRSATRPLDVVAWHGNYAPCKYDLRTYCPVGAVLFDHPDPSIFTVLTAPSGLEGTANIDFVLFRERWIGGREHVPPALVPQERHVRADGQHLRQSTTPSPGLRPGRHEPAQLHAAARAGPRRRSSGASNAELKPQKLDDTMSFMFETRFPQHLTEFAAKEAPLQDDYIDCWTDLEKKFDGTPDPK